MSCKPHSDDAPLTETQSRNVQSRAAQASNAQKVRAFHEAIGAAYPDQPQVPGLTTLELRLTLLREEMQEVEAEFGQLSPPPSAAPDLPTSRRWRTSWPICCTSLTARWAAWAWTPTRCSPRSTAPT